MTTAQPFEPDEVSILVDHYRVEFKRDGAGVVIRVIAPNGENIAWDRMGSTTCTWLAAVLR